MTVLLRADCLTPVFAAKAGQVVWGLTPEVERGLAEGGFADVLAGGTLTAPVAAIFTAATSAGVKSLTFNAIGLQVVSGGPVVTGGR